MIRAVLFYRPDAELVRRDEKSPRPARAGLSKNRVRIRGVLEIVRRIGGFYMNSLRLWFILQEISTAFFRRSRYFFCTTKIDVL